MTGRLCNTPGHCLQYVVCGQHCPEQQLLAAFWSIKDNPRRQPFTEVLEAVRHACGHKQEIAGAELDAFVAHHKVALPLHHHITLITGVRLLWIMPDRFVQFYR